MSMAHVWISAGVQPSFSAGKKKWHKLLLSSDRQVKQTLNADAQRDGREKSSRLLFEEQLKKDDADSEGGWLHSLPARSQRVLQGKQIKHASQCVIDHFFDGSGTVVEAGKRWENDATHFSDGCHIAQMREIKRGFTHHQYQTATFLEDDVSTACDQVVR